METSNNENTSGGATSQHSDVFDGDNLFYLPWEKIESKARSLCVALWPEAQHDRTEIDFLAEGGHNKVLSVTIHDDKGCYGKYVIRLPCSEKTILSSVSTLRYLYEHTTLQVPKVIYFDNTRNNSLGYGYIVLERLRGRNLQSCWEDLSQDQRLVVAEEIGELYLRLRATTSPIAGELKVSIEDAGTHVKDPESHMVVEPFGVRMDGLDLGIRYDDGDNDSLPLDRLMHDPPNLPVDDMMLAPFKRRIYQATHSALNTEYMLDIYQPCLGMIQDMVAMRLFETQGTAEFSLWHTDLWPRNIMVDFTSSPVITGILDWDAPVFAPRFFVSTPPRWLWQEDHEQEHSDIMTSLLDSDTEPLDRSEIEADTPENKEVKKRFEEVVGEEWCRLAYEPEFVFARRTLMLSQRTTWSDEEEEEVEIMKEAWDRHYQGLTEQPEAGDTMEKSSGSTKSDSLQDDTLPPLDSLKAPSPSPGIERPDALPYNSSKLPNECLVDEIASANATLAPLPWRILDWLKISKKDAVVSYNR